MKMRKKMRRSKNSIANIRNVVGISILCVAIFIMTSAFQDPVKNLDEKGGCGCGA